MGHCSCAAPWIWFVYAAHWLLRCKIPSQKQQQRKIRSHESGTPNAPRAKDLRISLKESRQWAKHKVGPRLWVNVVGPHVVCWLGDTVYVGELQEYFLQSDHTSTPLSPQPQAQVWMHSEAKGRLRLPNSSFVPICSHGNPLTSHLTWNSQCQGTTVASIGQGRQFSPEGKCGLRGT